ncbi:SDR family NAD(P)-dependent oxidoreductase [Henriciella pelagia]|jgi:NAD(P)-dependent dehydrogenase (short-subunit alcohol dehydrogenase family)|uniref:3-oxoacyl-ACP reductase n=3 Tax=Henriciella pelagia TaxID=1977912 RepID=A0ABQ1JXD3_9PROT|nr:SDR family oxidoreductase [Henriciella pelagia]GGB78324.1 3-oxoacyl-ACP reductase [Henriciella pelagia]
MSFDTKSTHPIALITGSSRGLGKSEALALAKAGADLIITYHSSADEADAVVREIEALGRKAVALQLDASDVSTFPRFADTVKSALSQTWNTDNFDFLVNNAGTAGGSTIADTSEADFDDLVNIHLKGVYFLTQTLLPLIADGGRIINTSSGLTRFSYAGFSAYAMMKGAIEVFTRYLAVELGERGITANTVAPGPIATDFGGGLVRDNPEFRNSLADQTPLGRVGEADDVGGVVASLLTSATRWINGERIEVAGGFNH